MKRVIFSVYKEVNDNSVTDYKKEQLKLYKDKLIKRQHDYAKFCGADYFVFENNNFVVDEYNSIQFFKIYQFEKLANEYDEILYLDLDIIPFKFINFFENQDLSKLCCFKQDGEEWGLKRYFSDKTVKYKYQVDRKNYQYFYSLDSQNWYIKACAKNAMLLLGDYGKLNNMIINTGVLGGNKELIKSINFSNQLNDMIKLMEEAKEDNLYPDDISKLIKPNNEVFLTYLVEKNNIPVNNMNEIWNYIQDDLKCGMFSPQGHYKKSDIWKKIIFLHLINKLFEKFDRKYNIF